MRERHYLIVPAEKRAKGVHPSQVCCGLADRKLFETRMKDKVASMSPLRGREREREREIESKAKNNGL